MKQKLKAEELVQKYITTQRGFFMPHQIAVECAKIAVEEIIEAGNNIISELIDGYEDLEFNNYWQEVKKELNKML